MKITYLPHALRRMDERRIAQWEVAAVLEAPAVEYPGHVFDRVVAERVLPGRRRVMPYRLEHDPESGAFYIRVRDGEYHETIPLGEPGFGASVDVDAEGNVLGFEFLSIEEYAELIDHAGSLEVPDRLETTPVEEDPSPAELMAALTPREREVLRLLIEGLTTQEVASRLSISQAAVKQRFRHVVGVFRARSAKESSSRPGTISS